MENGKCACYIFYGGEFCEKFLGCPPGTNEICETVLSTNGFQRRDFVQIKEPEKPANDAEIQS